MGLESAIGTSREGLNAHGRAIAVVGDNIANVNTTAYKASRPEFADILGEVADQRNSSTVSGIGDGVAIGNIRTIQEPGPIEPTGRELDIAISGNGFFMVGDAAAPQYTRVGSLEINAAGNLITASGKEILGYTGLDEATLGPINMTTVDTAGSATTQAQVFGNLNGAQVIGTAPANPATFRELSAALPFSSSQTIYDSQGARREVLFGFVKTGLNTWTVQAYVDGGDVGGTEGVPTLLGEATLAFDGSGAMPEANRAQAQLTMAANWGNGADPSNVVVDFSGMTQFAGVSALKSINQDGEGQGGIQSYEFGTDGTIFAILDTGTRAQVGRIPLAVFPGADALERAGSSVFTPTERAGQAAVGKAGEGARGTIEDRTLERSTVDIAKQFVDLVVYQRAYQASSQVLSAANQMMQGTIQLIR
jgi:flagellar hook protein FlgE